MPVIFLLSAIVSGISVLAVSYVVVMKIKKQPVDSACLKSLFTYLWAFFILDVTLESLEVITMLYESHEEWHITFPDAYSVNLGSVIFFSRWLSVQ